MEASKAELAAREVADPKLAKGGPVPTSSSGKADALTMSRTLAVFRVHANHLSHMADQDGRGETTDAED